MDACADSVDLDWLQTGLRCFFLGLLPSGMPINTKLIWLFPVLVLALDHGIPRIVDTFSAPDPSSAVKLRANDPSFDEFCLCIPAPRPDNR